MNFDDLHVKLDENYPEIINASEDKTTIAILKNLANSRKGELAGILTYIFQSVVADKVDSSIAEVFEEVAIVEMMHLELLMHAISLFGGIPKYDDGQGNFFNAGFLNYSMKLKDMLENNIQDEKVSIEDYKRAIGMVKNDSLKKLFARFIKDEEQHLRVFEQIKNNVEFLSIN